MREIRENLLDNIKKQLGYIIKQNRNIKYQDYKGSIKDNPYSKNSFCESICHYHTLTKLENSFIREDKIYYKLLDKLGLKFNVTLYEHENNMKILKSILYDLLKAMEYIDDDLINHIKQDIESLGFELDCIALIHLKLINFVYYLHFIKKIEDYMFIEIRNFYDFYEGLFKGLANHCLGIYYTNKVELKKALNEINQAKEIYNSYNISQGVINICLLNIYTLNKDYYKVITLCKEMEPYYLETNNYKRLLHVYNSLSEYYLNIDSKEIAQKYHNKVLDLIKNHNSLKRYEHIVNFNFGVFNLNQGYYEDALYYIRLCYIKNKNIRFLNILLFLLIKLNYPDEEIKEYVKQGIDMSVNASLTDEMIFKYHLYRTKKSRYFRRYTIQKLIPYLKERPNYMDFLLIIYQDLYE